MKVQPIDFNTWMERVDIHLINYVGLISDELIDVDYAVAYESGMTPQAAAKFAIRENCEEMGLNWRLI